MPATINAQDVILRAAGGEGMKVRREAGATMITITIATAKGPLMLTLLLLIFHHDEV